MKNRYNGTCTLGPIKATNFVSDCGIVSAKDFQNADFKKKLVNWSVTQAKDGLVTTEQTDGQYGKLEACEDGETALFEGLYLTAGNYKLTATAGAYGCEAELFVRDLNGDTISTLKITTDSAIRTLEFTVSKKGTYRIGLAVNAKSGYGTLDDCKLELISDYEPKAQADFTENFDGELAEVWQFNSVWSVGEGKDKNGYAADSSAGYAALKTLYKSYTDVTVSLDVKFNSWSQAIGDNNFGFLLCCDDEETQYYFVEYTDIASTLQIREFSSKNPGGVRLGAVSLKLNEGEWHNFKVTLKDGQLTVKINTETLLECKTQSKLNPGMLAVNTYYVNCNIDNVSVSTK